jgi:ribA/ribD-fused uncharacterized protein
MKKTEKFVFFWKTEDVFSNWHPATFTDYRDNVTYNCSEQFMMRYKALLFGDTETAEQIMKETTPREQKRLGRLVKGFDMTIWKLHAKRIVTEACFLKFIQNEEMLHELMITKDQVLVEASPSDLLWGIGMGQDDPGVEDPNNWKGTNWLGEVLNTLRGMFETEMALRDFQLDEFKKSHGKYTNYGSRRNHRQNQKGK